VINLYPPARAKAARQASTTILDDLSNGRQSISHVASNSGGSSVKENRREAGMAAYFPHSI